MDYVFVHDQAEVATDGARSCLCRVGSAHEGAALGNSAFTGNNHLNNRAGGDVGNQAIIERLALVLLVVSSSLLGGNHTHFHALDLQTSTLEAVYDFADMTVANTVGLDHAVGLFNCHVGSFQMNVSFLLTI